MNSPDPEIKSKFDMSSIKYPNKILADLFLKPAKKNQIFDNDRIPETVFSQRCLLDIYRGNLF